MANPPVIEYYFSFISLWSYIGSQRLETLTQRHNASIIHKPIDILHLFSVSGGQPVPQRAPQRQAYRLLEMQRWCRARGDLPIVPHPRFFPADPSLAHRVLLAAAEELGHDHAAVREFARRGLATVWADEGNIADPATVEAVATAAGLEGGRLLERARAEEARLAEREAALTREAIARNLFGAPVYVYREEPFWGQDRLEMLDDVITSGRDAIPLPVIDS